MLYLHLLLWPKYVSNYDDKVLCIPYNGIRVRNTYIFHDPKMWYYPLSSVDQISKSLKLYGIKVKQKLWRRESFGSSAICVNVLYWYNPNLSLDIFSEYLFIYLKESIAALCDSNIIWRFCESMKIVYLFFINEIIFVEYTFILQAENSLVYSKY